MKPLWAATPCVLLALVSTNVHAEPRLVERVVARVDGSPILLSELRERTRPYRDKLAREPLARRAVTLRELYQTELQSLIDSALLARVARFRGISISDRDVDSALDAIAKSQAVDRDELRALALAAGYSFEEYRAEVRRQLVEQRLIREDAANDPPPREPGALASWTARRRAAVLRAARRRTCIELLVRWSR